MYALASLGLRCSAGGFCAAGAAFGALQEVGCTPWRPLLSAGFSMVGAAFGASASDRMYALASLVSAALPVAFAWQAQHLVLCKGSDARPGVLVSAALLVAFAGQARHLVPCRVGCTPWRPLVSALRGRRSTWCSVRGRMYALASLGLRCFLRGRRSTCCSARGRMYALACFGLRRSSGSFWHWLLCKGSDTPCASLGLRRFAGRFCVAGPALGALQGVGYALASLGLRWLLRGRRGNWCSARGRMYVWRPLVSAAFCVAGAALAALQGVGCTPWRPLVSAALPVAFAWQAQHLVRCKGTDVRPGVRWSPPLCSAQVMLFRSRARRCINSAHSD